MEQPPILTVLRLFVALELPSEVQNIVSAQMDILRQAMPPDSVRWSRQQNLHLTLKFLGDTLQSRVTSVIEATEAALQGFAALDLTVQGVGCFPNTRRPKVIWMGLGGEIAHLTELQKSVETHLAPLGFPAESREFKPHLTLGRVKATEATALNAIGEAVEHAPNHAGIGWSATSVSVIHSILKPSGAVYKPLAHYLLESKG